MPIDIALAESAYLGGSTRYENWRDEFEFNWNKPVMETAIGEYLHNMDPVTEELLKQFIPKEMSELKKKYGG